MEAILFPPSNILSQDHKQISYKHVVGQDLRMFVQSVLWTWSFLKCHVPSEVVDVRWPHNNPNADTRETCEVLRKDEVLWQLGGLPTSWATWEVPSMLLHAGWLRAFSCCFVSCGGCLTPKNAGRFHSESVWVFPRDTVKPKLFPPLQENILGSVLHNWFPNLKISKHGSTPTEAICWSEGLWGIQERTQPPTSQFSYYSTVNIWSKITSECKRSQLFLIWALP